jgi:hypothetical protein
MLRLALLLLVVVHAGLLLVRVFAKYDMIHERCLRDSAPCDYAIVVVARLFASMGRCGYQQAP